MNDSKRLLNDHEILKTCIKYTENENIKLLFENAAVSNKIKSLNKNWLKQKKTIKSPHWTIDFK